MTPLRSLFRSHRVAIAICAVVLAAGCMLDGPITGGAPRACTDEARPAFAVLVKDAETGDFIGSGATLVVQEGAFIDSLVVPSGQPHLNAQPLTTPGTYERPGTYVVRVRRPPYIEVAVIGVQVLSDGCHVITKAMTFALPTSPPTP